MLVAVHTSFAADRREPLGALLERVQQAFVAAGEGEPRVQFALSDSGVNGFVSSVDRVLKRYPEMERFLVTAPASSVGGPLAQSVRQLGNHAGSPAAGEEPPFATLQAIAAGVPRSFPFHNVGLRLSSPAFGSPPTRAGLERLGITDRARLHDALGLVPGVVIGDSWWVNHRQRQLSALTIVDADPGGKKLPPLPPPVAAILAGCGKTKKTMQVPLPEAAPGAGCSAGPSRSVTRNRDASAGDRRRLP